MRNFHHCIAPLVPGILLLVGSSAVGEEFDDAHHEIDEIIITAVPLKRTVEQLAQPTTVLFGDELTKKQSTSIGESVSAEPGISSTYFGPIASRPVIRGQFGERVRVLSNGLDSLDASALSEDHQATVEGILADRIEIVRGPATLMYGTGAAGGLVNIVDNRIVQMPLEEAIAGTAVLGADTAMSKREGAAQLIFGSQLFGFSADYSYRKTGNVSIPGFAESEILAESEGEERDPADYGELHNTASMTETGGLSASLTTSNGYVGMTYSIFDSDYGVPGHAHEEDGGGTADSVSIDLKQDRIDLQGEYEFDGFIEGIRFRAANNDYTHIEFEGADIGTVFENSGTDGRVEFRHRTIAGFEGAFGIQGKQIDFNAIGDEAFVPPSETSRSSLFLFEEISISQRWVLQGSGRAEKQSITTPAAPEKYNDTAYGASLGLLWQTTDAVRVSLNTAITDRHPTSTELYADGPHVAAQRYERGSVSNGDGFLDKEHSVNIDLTVHGDTGALEWSLTGFVNRIDDYVVLSPTAEIVDDYQVYQYRNTDAEFTGLEADVRLEVLDRGDNHLHIRVFGDMLSGKEKTNNTNLPRLTPSRIGVGLHYTRQEFEVSVESMFVAKQDDVAVNELPTNGYSLLSADASYRFDSTDLLLFIRGTNLLDEEARQHTSPLKDLAPLPGRSFHAGLRWDF